MQISRCLVTFDKLSDYFPIWSTANSLVGLFLKYVVIPRLDKQVLAKSHYYTHLSQKSWRRCVVLLIPILGNLAVAIYDLQRGHSENSATVDLLDDKEFVLKAVRLDKWTLSKASSRLRKDPDFMLEVLKQGSSQFYQIDPELQENGPFMLAAISVNEWAWQSIGPKLKENPDFMLELLKQKKGINCASINPKLCENGPFMLAAMKISDRAWLEVGDRLRGDRSFMLAAIEIFPQIDIYAKENLKDDEAFVRAVIQRPSASGLYLASPRLRDNEGIVKEAIQRSALDLWHASDRLKANREIVLTAVRRNGSALFYADDSFKGDEEVVRTAIASTTAHILNWASEPLRERLRPAV